MKFLDIYTCWNLSTVKLNKLLYCGLCNKNFHNVYVEKGCLDVFASVLNWIIFFSVGSIGIWVGDCNKSAI